MREVRACLSDAIEALYKFFRQESTRRIKLHPLFYLRPELSGKHSDACHRRNLRYYRTLTPLTGYDRRTRIEAKILKIAELKDDVIEYTFQFIAPEKVAYHPGEFLSSSESGRA